MAYRPHWYNDDITYRQQKAIDLINEKLHYRFVPRCKGHAHDFISRHYETAKRIRTVENYTKETMPLVNRKLAPIILKEEGPWD